MKHLTTFIKNKRNDIAQYALSQVDTIGQALNHIGIQNTINRHTLIGQIWIQKHRLDGEKARFTIILHNKLRLIRKTRTAIHSKYNKTNSASSSHP